MDGLWIAGVARAPPRTVDGEIGTYHQAFNLIYAILYGLGPDQAHAPHDASGALRYFFGVNVRMTATL
jgi:hypothetical protein